jgi:hypothetical protein
MKTETQWRIVSKLPKSETYCIQIFKFKTMQEAEYFIKEFKAGNNMVEGEVAFVAEELIK